MLFMFTYVCMVRITLFCVNAAIPDDVLEGIVHESSIAAMVTLALCTRERHQKSFTTDCRKANALCVGEGGEL